MGLVQLCETAQPVGGYSYTLGIEQLARSGTLKTPEQVSALVHDVLRTTIGPADGVASGIAFRAARQCAFEQLPDLCATLSSERLPLPIRLASLQMGQRLWGLSRGWGWAASVHEQFDEMATRTDLHHAVAFGALVSEATSSEVRAIATYLFNTARNIVLCAIHAIPLDEVTGQRLLAGIQPAITELAAACADKHTADIAAFNPGPIPPLFP